MGGEVKRTGGVAGEPERLPRPHEALDQPQAPRPPQGGALPSMPQPLPAGNRGFIDIMDMPNTNKYSFDG